MTQVPCRALERCGILPEPAEHPVAVRTQQAAHALRATNLRIMTCQARMIMVNGKMLRPAIGTPTDEAPTTLRRVEPLVLLVSDPEPAPHS